MNTGKWLDRAALATALALFTGVCVARAQETPKSPDPAANVTVTKRSYDLAKVAASAVVPEAVHSGRAIWVQRCAYCHDGVGQPSYHTLGPWIGAETLENITEEGFVAFTQSGDDKMPGFAHSLNDRQMADLVAFVKTIGPDQKPTEAQLAGKPAKGTVAGD